MTSLLVALAVVLMSSRGGAYFYEFGPAKDEWTLKCDAEITAVKDNLDVSFTLTDQGRLKPIYSVSVIVFSNPRPVVRTDVCGE